MAPFSCGYLADSFPADFQDFVDLCKSNQKVLLPTVACTFQWPLMVHILKTLYRLVSLDGALRRQLGAVWRGLYIFTSYDKGKVEEIAEVCGRLPGFQKFERVPLSVCCIAQL